MNSRLADQEREVKLNELGDTLRVLEQYVDFAALAAAVDDAEPGPCRERGGRPPFPIELMARVASALGHASVMTTMVYTEQDALD